MVLWAQLFNMDYYCDCAKAQHGQMQGNNEGLRALQHIVLMVQSYWVGKSQLRTKEEVMTNKSEDRHPE